MCGGHGAPSEADETGAPAQILSLVPAAPGSDGTAAVAAAGGERAPLVSPPPSQVTAIVLARSVVNPKDKTPLTVAVAGAASVGAGLALPTLALQPANIRNTGQNTASVIVTQPASEGSGRPVISGAAAPVAASAATSPNLTPPSAPLALVPPTPKPGAISQAKKTAPSPQKNPAADASLVARGKANPVSASPGAVGSKKPEAKAEPTAVPTVPNN